MAFSSLMMVPEV